MLLECNSGAFPDDLTATACYELDRMAIGEPSPMFQVQPSRNKKSFKTVALEAWVCAMVTFEWKLTMRVGEDATQAVADKFRERTLIQSRGGRPMQRKSLAVKFGSLEIEFMKDRAREAARLERHRTGSRFGKQASGEARVSPPVLMMRRWRLWLMNTMPLGE